MQSSSSHSTRDDTSLANRLNTIFNKAHELSTLCGVEVCVIYYAPNGTLKTWPEERYKVTDMARRYNAATKRKKVLNLREFLGDEKNNKKTNHLKKKKKRALDNDNGIKFPTWYPDFDHYSPDQLSELILSLEQTLFALQERLRVIEAEKQRITNMAHQYSMNQPQPLNPNQFSLYMYNHQDSTLSELPLSDYQKLLMAQQTNTNIQQPCFSKSSSLLSGQELAVNNNNLMEQHELYGSDQNMSLMMSDITSSNAPCISNHTFSDVSCSDFQSNACGDMVCSSSSFSQDMQNTFSGYDGTLEINPYGYLLSNNSRFV